MNFISFLFRWKDLTQPSVIFEGGLRAIFYSICSLVYKMIFHVYNIFISLCNGQLLETDQLTNLFSRIGLLLGIVMSFRVALSFIQALIDPDSAFDSKKGVPGIIKKVILVIIMFGMSQYAFDLSRDLQVMIIKNDVIPNLVLPAEVNTENFGGALIANLFTAFYNVDPAVEDATSIEDQNCKDTYIAGLQTTIANNNDFSYMKNICLNSTATFEAEDGSKDEDFIIYFNFIFCLITGVFVLWFLFNYCIQVGMRIIQLVVLQVISPMAFIGYLSPTEDGTFKKWWKLYLSTYVDVFIRIAIIDFVCYLCALIMVNWNSGGGIFWSSVGSPEGFTRKLIGVFMIIALFTFAKKAPDLIKTLFPSTAGTALGFGTADTKGGLTKVGAAAVGGIGGGLVYGGLSAAARFRDQRKLNPDKSRGYAALAALGGLGSGIGRGWRTGLKGGNVFSNLRSGFSEQVSNDDAYRELVATGGSRLGQLKAGAANVVGTDRGTRDATRKKNAKRISDSLKGLFDAAENSQAYQRLMEEKTTAMRDGAWQKVDRLQKQADAFKNAFVDASLNKKLQTVGEDGLKYKYNGVEYSAIISGGDKIRGNGIRNSYIELASEVNQIHPEEIELDKDGNQVVVNHFSLDDVSKINAEAIDKILKRAMSTESNVMGSTGYRAGQANMPNRKNGGN